MASIRQRMTQRILVFLLLILGIILALYHFVIPYVVLNQREREVYEDYVYLCTLKPSDYQEESAAYQSILSVLHDECDFMLCDESLEVVACSEQNPMREQVRDRIRRQRAYFIDSSETQVTYNDKSPGQTVDIKTSLFQDGKRYYLYVYHDAYMPRGFHKHAEQVLAIVSLILFLTMAIGLPLLNRSPLSDFDALAKELHALSGGDYTTKALGRLSAPELAQAREDIDLLSDTLYYQMQAIQNYEYLARYNILTKDEAMEADKHLVNTVTHQLKTPLAIISNQVELCQLEEDPAKRDFYYNSVLQEIDKMGMLVTNILQDGRPRQAALEAHLGNTCISDLALDLCAKYEPWLRARGLDFHYTISKDLVVLADPIQVEHALNNYMMNAVSHTRKGRAIHLSLHKDGEDCLLCLHNEGDGIPESELEGIWTPYFQRSGVRKSDEIGLGLYIVMDIMQRHHGACGVRNDETGVEFWLRFPHNPLAII